MKTLNLSIVLLLLHGYCVPGEGGLKDEIKRLCVKLEQNKNLDELPPEKLKALLKQCGHYFRWAQRASQPKQPVKINHPS